MGDDWETEPDFVNDVSEKEQRWGSKTVPGSGRQAYIDMNTLREEVKQADRQNKLKTAPKPSYGYGGKFGVERDRMDKSAVGHDHVEVVEKHASQKDHSLGFGGKFGIQSDRQDKSALGWDQKEQVEKHASQKDYSVGFGGKYGVQKDRQDASAVGWDHREQVPAHSSQTDYSKGFGGKYGVQTDRADTTASATSDQSEDIRKLHPSQWKPEVRGQAGGISSLRSQFESKARTTVPVPGEPTAAQKRIAEERARWEAERKNNAAANVPPSAAEELPSPTREPVPEAVPEICPDVQPEPASTQYEQHEEQATAEIPDSCDVPLGTAIALYDYYADDVDELTFSVGELITEIEKIDPGWWKGVCRGKVGLFPSNYVQEQS